MHWVPLYRMLSCSSSVTSEEGLRFRLVLYACDTSVAAWVVFVSLLIVLGCMDILLCRLLRSCSRTCCTHALPLFRVCATCLSLSRCHRLVIYQSESPCAVLCRQYRLTQMLRLERQIRNQQQQLCVEDHRKQTSHLIFSCARAAILAAFGSRILVHACNDVGAFTAK